MVLRFDILVSGLVIFVMLSPCKHLSASGNPLPRIPCPDIFQYARSGNKNIGIITVDNIKHGETTVAVELSQPGSMNSDNPGQLSLNFNKSKAFEYIAEGKPFTYRVDFPLQNIVPRVTFIEVNGVRICSGPKYGSPSTTMNLEYTLKAFSSRSASSQQSDLNNNFRRLPSWPNFNQGSDFTSDFSSFNPSSFPQPSSSQITHNSISPSFSRPSFNSPFLSKQSRHHPSVYQPSFSHHLTSQHSTNQAPLNTPAIDPLTFSFPPFNQPSFNRSSLSEPTYNNQTPPQFKVNPQNPYFKTLNGGESFGSIGSDGPRNPQPTYAPPSPLAPTTRALAVSWPAFTAPTTTNSPMTRPTFEIDPRNPETSSTATPVTDTTAISEKPSTTVTDTTAISEKPSTDRATLKYINSVCGQENLNFDVNKLNIKGTEISRLRFPWIVAVFRRVEDDLIFRCGGSLISTRTVVSAAHCFFLGFQAMNPEEIMVSMGRHNLTDWLGASNIDVESVIQHPDFDPTLIKLDADVAIIRLKHSVTFTTSVRPICMWQGPKDAREIEGVSGVIVGWGSDTLHKTTIVPTLVNATVVSEITCIRSNYQFFFLTSNRTLCAGNLDGSGPCMGDSGNGLMIRNKNKWMLRGTVSATVGTPTRPCNLEQYAIYSDIAMFIEWIRLNMLL